jgi:hypothetical protein
MGTNYYVKVPSDPIVCSECGRQRDVELLHIGKSSRGWCFALHVIPSRGLISLDAWASFLRPREIQDEYGTKLDFDEMMAIILDREGVSNSLAYSDDFLEKNCAELGPKGLLRHRLHQSICVGHGAGTWDLMKGTFS